MTPRETDDSDRPATPPVVVVAPLDDDPVLAAQAKALAGSLGLPLVASSGPAPDVDLVLRVGPGGLELWDPNRGAPGAIRADLVGGALGARLRRGVGRREPLGRALGVSGGPDGRPLVLDATAGLGRDTALAAALGCVVHAHERSPVVGALLRDALQRARTEPRLVPVVDRIDLTLGDARDALVRLRLDENATPPDVVLLDPMFPPRRKSALVRKEMRLLAKLVGGTGDDGELFTLALAVARRRVVVKRPTDAPPLSATDPAPRQVVAGGTIRYDVYAGGGA